MEEKLEQKVAGGVDKSKNRDGDIREELIDEFVPEEWNDTFSEIVLQEMKQDREFRSRMLNMVWNKIAADNQLWDKYMPKSRIKKIFARLKFQESTGDDRSLYDQMMHKIGQSDEMFAKAVEKEELRLNYQEKN